MPTDLPPALDDPKPTVTVLRERSGDMPPLLNRADLERAIQADLLELHYQPIVDLERGGIVGLEALARWRHPELGLLPPELFIPLAESTGLIIELGRSVLRTACQQAASWHRQGLEMDISVNVSVHQVTRPGFVDQVRCALETSGLSPERLVLEVTESAVMEDAQAAVAALAEIRQTGVTIAIDDFGTGYSSLVYLKRYPISILKIDRSFIAGLCRNSDDDAIVASIVGLARGIGALCVAEGVETPEQQAHLLALGCDRVQGFLHGPAVPAAQVPAAVEAARETVVRVAPAPRRGRPGTPSTAPVPEEVLVHMGELMDSGASYPTIAAALNQMGSLHPKGTRWHRTSVARYVREHLVPTRQEAS